MPFLRFTIRDLFWLILVGGLSVGWWIGNRLPEEAVVAAYVVDKNDADLIEVSIGEDDGVKVGQWLHLLRGNIRLGKAKVIATSPDRTVARRGDRERVPIRKGDTVVTLVRVHR